MSGNESNEETVTGTPSSAAVAIVDQQKIASRAENICGHCMKKCTKTGRGSLALKCDYCKYLYHADCEGLSTEQYQALSQLASVLPNVNYYCVFGHCKQVSDEMIKLLGPTVKKVEENTKRIEALEKECEKQFNGIDAKIVREVKENTEDIIDSKVKNAWTTEKERAKRARNIILSNFPEPT